MFICPKSKYWSSNARNGKERFSDFSHSYMSYYSNIPQEYKYYVFIIDNRDILAIAISKVNKEIDPAQNWEHFKTKDGVECYRKHV